MATAALKSESFCDVRYCSQFWPVARSTGYVLRRFKGR